MTQVSTVKIGFESSGHTAQILSLLSAVILWVSVSLNMTYSYKIELPINYIGPSDGYVVTSPRPEHVLVRIQGNGKELLSFCLEKLFDQDRHYALVNLTGLTTQGRHQIDVDPSMINLDESEDLSVEGILENAFFSVMIDKIVTRTVPVDAGSLPSFRAEKGYVIVGKPQPHPPLLVVQGAESAVDTLTSVRVTSFLHDVVSPVDSTLKARVGEYLPPGIYLDPDIIDLTVGVDRLVDRTFSSIPVRLNGFPGSRRPAYAPDSLAVEVSGPESLINTLKPSDITLTVTFDDFQKVSAGGDSIVKPVIKVPEGLSDVRITPDHVIFPRRGSQN